MILSKPAAIIEHIMSYEDPLNLISNCGKTCYKSENKSQKTSDEFVRMIIDRGHESVLEHSAATVRFIIDRGVSHELVRHRLAAFSQESTRYCDYRGGVEFIIPPWVDIEPGEYDYPAKPPTGIAADRGWFRAMLDAEDYYRTLRVCGWLPQQARSVLPNSLKTEIVMTANFREWRHVLKLRCSKAAHPQMREVMVPLLAEFREHVPVVFDNL